MSKEKNKIHVARHIDLLQESSSIVPNLGRLDNKCPVSWKRATASESRWGSAAVRLLPGLSENLRPLQPGDLGAQNRAAAAAAAAAACRDRRNSVKQESMFVLSVQICSSSTEPRMMFSYECRSSSLLVGFFEVLELTQMNPG